MAVETEKRVTIKGQKGPHKVLDETPGMVQVENSRGDSFWVPRFKIVPEAAPKPRSLGAAAARELATYTPRPVKAENLDDSLVAFLAGRLVDIRIHYPQRSEQRLQTIAATEGFALPDDMRPVAFGLLGGTHESRDWNTEVHFPADTPQTLLPHGTKKTDKGLICYRRAVAVALLKAGFQLTSYAKAA